MEIDFYTQTTAFLYSLVLGVALGVVYGVFKAIRTIFFSSRVSVIICDILFMLLACMSLFFYSLAMLYGYIRVYVIIGILFGFSVYRLTLGRIFFNFYMPVISFMRKILRKITSKIKIYSKKLLKNLYKILYNINRKISTFRNKRKNLSDEKKVKAKDERKKQKRENKHIA